MAPTKRPGRPRTGESPAEADQILAAALHAFATYGYEGTSIRTLNRELGVSHNLINQRFGTKAALWRAAVDRGFEPVRYELMSSVDPTISDPLAQLNQVIRVGIRLGQGSGKSPQSGKQIHHLPDKRIPRP